MKKFIIVLLTVLVCGCSAVAVAEGVNRVQPGDGGTEWRIKSTTSNGMVTSGSEQYYSSYTATRDGETHTISVTQRYIASISGQIAVTIGKVEASVGFENGEEFAVSASTTSAPLSAGETVDAYWQKRFQKFTIQQEQVHWEVVNTGTSSKPVLEIVEQVIATKTAYAYKPVSPKIRLSYYGVNSLGQRVLLKVETIE